MQSPFVGLRTRVLAGLDHLFPPNPSAYMSPEKQTRHEARKAITTAGSYLAQLPSPEIDVLDYGCGWGGETLWLAERVRSATGVDTNAHSIAQANAALGASGISSCRFVHTPDGRLPFASESFDAVFSSDTLEHVEDLDLAFNEIFRVIRRGGTFVTRFGPLFYSPNGYHLYWVTQVPYAHLLFGLEPLLHLRQARSGTDWRAGTWKEMGVNQKRFRDYERSAVRAGFSMTRFQPIPVRRLHTLARVPVLRDFLIFGVDCHIRRPR
jgi:SAM-dependent methyltransferase